MAQIKMIVAVALLLIACLHHVECTVPDQGFYMITNTANKIKSGPKKGKGKDVVYLYALETLPVGGDSIEFSKKTGLPSSIVETGVVETMGGIPFGCYLKVYRPNRLEGIRYGTYTATYTAAGSTNIDASGYTFVKRKTKLLDTNGKFTATIYPSASGATSLSMGSPTTIGVKWTPGCRTIKWCKGKAKIKNTGPKLTLSSVNDAALYTIRRRTRSSRGWFAQIKVIAARCPEAMFWNTGTGACAARVVSVVCLYGVGRNAEDTCICSPYFCGANCDTLVTPVPAPDNGPYVLAIDGGNYLQCKDLPGGNERCRGHLFCLGDLYGCKCGPGWYGNFCDRLCPKGTWGPSCMWNCPSSNSACNPHFGT